MPDTRLTFTQLQTSSRYEVNIRVGDSEHRCDFTLGEFGLMFYNERRVFATLRNPERRIINEKRKLLLDAGNRLYKMFGISPKMAEALKQSQGAMIFEIPATLWQVPWELLIFPGDRLWEEGAVRPIIRRLRLGPRSSEEDDKLKEPKMLFVSSEPSTEGNTFASRQWEVIQETAREFKVDHLLQSVSSNSRANERQWDKLARSLQRNRPHILHIAAHGSHADGFVLEGESGSIPNLISYESFVNKVREAGCVRLLVLSICNSAQPFIERPDLLEGLATSSNFCALVVMATDISVPGAEQFSKQFYYSLCTGADVGYAIGSARNHLRGNTDLKSSIEWSTPIMYQQVKYAPLEKWNTHLKQEQEVTVLQKEGVETVEEALQNLREKVRSLVTQQPGIQRSGVQRNYACREVEAAVNKFHDAMTLLNRRYNVNAQGWVNNIRAVSSRSLPKVEHYVSIVRSNSSDVHEQTTLASMALAACEDLVRVFSS